MSLMKTCSVCKENKSISEFSNRLASKDGKMPKCKPCHRKSVVQWRKDNPQKRKEQSRRESAKLKSNIIEAYGGFCVCCGETEPEFLSIDHIDGNGAELRRNKPREKDNIYRMLRQNNFPKENYQLLCLNCNWSKGNGPKGECVHSRTVKLELTINESS